MVRFCSAEEFNSLCKEISCKASRLCLQAKGGSMYPFIRSGDWTDVELFGQTPKNISKGDIVLFKKDSNLYLHRAVRIEKDGFISKGDMSFGHDGYIPAEDVIARVIAVSRGSRRIDMRTKFNRFFNRVAADVSIFYQYPLLLAGKACDSGMKVFLRLQAFKIYRLILKKFLNAEVIIRPAGEQDTEQLKDLYLMAGHDIRDGLASIKNEGFWFVAEMKNRIVAGLTMTRYEKDPALWVIFGLEVKPLFRGMGIGRRILKEAVRSAGRSGAERIGLFVNKRSRPALDLYRRFGFKASDDFPRDFNCSPDEYYLSYNLGPVNVEQLLISLTKGGFEARNAYALSRFKPDFHFVLDRAVQEGVFYPAFTNLLALEAKAKQIPDKLLERFKQTYYLHISRSADLIDRVERVLERIESLKIKVLLFKGPAIDDLIYDGFMRPRLDLDIAVRDEEIGALEAALAGLGYAMPENNENYPIPEYVNSRLFIHRSDSLMPVHVHRNLINNMFLTVDNELSMDMDRVWEHTEHFKNYRYICVLKPEINIIYLCEHGLKHDFDQIVFLYEIEKLISHYKAGLDWKELLTLAGDLGLKRPAYYGLYFAKEVLSADVPQEAIDELKPERFAPGEKIFIKNTLDNKHRRYCSYPVYLAMRKGLFKKANFVFHTIFPPGFTFNGYLARMFRLILP